MGLRFANKESILLTQYRICIIRMKNLKIYQKIICLVADAKWNYFNSYQLISNVQMLSYEYLLYWMRCKIFEILLLHRMLKIDEKYRRQIHQTNGMFWRNIESELRIKVNWGNSHRKLYLNYLLSQILQLDF